MTTLRHSPDFNLILMPATQMCFSLQIFLAKLWSSRLIGWLVIMIWWWHCVERMRDAGHWTGGAKFLIFSAYRSEARGAGDKAMLWSSQYLCHIDTSPASLICDHNHDTAQYLLWEGVHREIMMNIRWSHLKLKKPLLWLYCVWWKS